MWGIENTYELVICLVCGNQWNRRDFKHPVSHSTAVEYKGTECPKCGATGFSPSANRQSYHE